MGTFATDRDLLALEPTLLRDVGFAAQVLARATASVSSGVLTVSGGGGVNFTTLGVTTGSIVSVDGVPLEVLSRTGNTTLVVSLLRGSDSDPQIVPGPMSNLALVVATFMPQIVLAHNSVLSLAGLGSGQLGAAEPISESAVVNGPALKLLECLGALHLIYSAASAWSPAGSGGSRGGASGTGAVGRAEMYRERFSRERARVRVLLDLDGDGVADSERSLNWREVVRG